MNILIISIFIPVGFFTALKSNAENCEYYKNEIEYFSSLRRNGGDADQMDYWKNHLDYLEGASRNCRQKTQNIGTVAPTNNSNYSHQEHHYSEVSSRRVRPTETTCNYWINEVRKNPSFDNKNYRDIVCTTSNGNEGAASNPRSQVPKTVRTLKECIKRNNVIDSDVNECIKGNKIPIWNSRSIY